MKMRHEISENIHFSHQSVGVKFKWKKHEEERTKARQFLL